MLINTGGFSLAHLDSVIVPYAEKTYQAYLEEFREFYPMDLPDAEEKADKYATERVRKDLYNGVQQLEYKFNTVASSRGDFSFITVSFGMETNKWGKMFSEALMDVRMKGQGEPAVPVLFPKLVFLASLEKLHGEGKPNRDLFLKACECSNRCMYPRIVGALCSDI